MTLNPIKLMTKLNPHIKEVMSVSKTVLIIVSTITFLVSIVLIAATTMLYTVLQFR